MEHKYKMVSEHHMVCKNCKRVKATNTWNSVDIDECEELNAPNEICEKMEV